MSDGTVLEYHDFSVGYEAKPVLYGVDLAVGAGQLIGIIGPNGAGKSTLLKATLGLLPVQGGWVKAWGQSVASQVRRLAYLPQRSEVDWDFPVSVMDVALMGTFNRLGVLGRPGKRERELAFACLEQVGMAEFAQRPIGNLSGGQQQRVFLARALAQQADLFLMDEPFTGVDAATEELIVELLRGLRDRGKTVLVVHHDLQTAAEYFDKLLLLNMRVVGFGAVADVFNDQFLRETYGGRLNLLSEVALKRMQRGSVTGGGE